MEKKLTIAVIVLLVMNVITLVGYFSKDTKNYEAACLQADFIRYLIDHFDGETECANIGSEIEDCYYEWFQELDNGNFKTKHITDIRDFEEYSWCY